MHLRNKPWLALALIAGGTLIALYAVDRFQHRFVHTGADLIRLLPGGDATIFYAQVDALRHAGMLGLLADSKSAQDAEYRSFVRATQFDYSKDVDAVAGSVANDRVLLAIKGRFDWFRIRTYVLQQGGACTPQTCALRGTRDGDWIGITRIQPDVLGVSLGPRPGFSSAIHPGQQAMAQPLPTEPAWVKLAPSVLKNPGSLPLALRIFAISVQPADSIVIGLAGATPGSADAFEINLYAQCPSASTADTIRNQLQIETKMLKLELAHENQQPSPADLTGLLTAGTFSTNGKEVTGEWPVRKELLKTLQQ
ncbi:MAG: hypothetical protein JO051_11890 [Acidobacteriaceae bacterium]|nr:hypothetical protein [Acidobacteriaceae bacterium]